LKGKSFPKILYYWCITKKWFSTWCN